MRKTQQKNFDSDIKNIYSPKKSLNSAIHFIKSGFLNLIFSRDQEIKEYIHSNETTLNQYLEVIPTDMNVQESMMIVDELNILHTLMH